MTQRTQPDAGHMIRWCREILPAMLVKVCHVEPVEAAAVGEDVLSRATAFAMLPVRTRDVVIAPFLEEIFDHEPVGVPLSLLGATTVAVRNSRLEHSHAGGLVDAGGLRALTTAAAAPLSHLLGAIRRDPIEILDTSPFEGLATTYPRAWACLEALADVVGHDSGRQSYRAPAVDAMPSLPQPHEIVSARPAQHVDGATIFDSVDARFDEELMNQLRTVTQDDDPATFFVSALSRFSRNSHKQLRVIELLLAHNTTIVTTNYMLRPQDVWVRRRPLVKPDSFNPIERLRIPQGLGGAHRRVITQWLESTRPS